MKRALYFLWSVLTLFLAGQTWGQQVVEIPYNPDVDDDEVIAILDLMGVLAIYGDAFSPDEVMVNNQTLTHYLQELQSQLGNGYSDTLFVPSIISGTADGQMLFWADEQWQLLNPGEAGQVLKINESGHPAWSTAVVELDCIVGCDNPLACNYDAASTVTFSGACDFTSCRGCTDELYIEFNPLASIDDGSCSTLIVEGCTLPEAENYAPEATVDDGSCIIPLVGCEGQDNITFDGYTYELVQIGSTCWFAENLRTTAYSTGDPIQTNLNSSQWSSTNLGAAAVYGEGSSNCDGNCDENFNLDRYGRLYNYHAVTDWRNICPSGWHVSEDSEWQHVERLMGMEEAGIVSFNWRGGSEGAMMKSAMTDVPPWNGTNESGMSALGGGQRSSTGAFSDASSSGYWWTLTSGFRQLSSTTAQSYRSASSSSSDLGYAVRCVRNDSYSVTGCMNPRAPNYDDSAIFDDGSCAFPACGDVATLNYQGYDYDLIQIGDQCWFAENLRTTVYADGTTIPANRSDAQWTSTTSGATAVYGEGSSYCNSDCDEVANLEAYGRLYNWYAVDDSRGLCPTGWHVPTDGEWMTLEMELGMSSSEANDTGYRGTDEGKQLKSSPQASPSWNGYDHGDPLNSGFSALPGGFRNSLSGSFYSGGDNGNWWSASPDGTSYAWRRELNAAYDYVWRGNYYQRSGLSVRCVRDE